MTSDRKIAANQNNGRRSRGPRTAAGKAKSRYNALAHGLAVSVLLDPARSAQVESLARAIAGDSTDNARLSQARIIAEAEIDLDRIQSAKITLMNSQVMPATGRRPADDSRPNHRDAGLESNAGDASCVLQSALELVPSIEALNQLSKLERYECRTIWRRRRALRALARLSQMDNYL